MKMNLLSVISTLFVIAACSCSENVNQKAQSNPAHSRKIVTDDYELIIPEKQDGLLILFPCYPCDAVHTRNEFNIVEIATENNIAILLMNFNQHLWLSEEEKQSLEQIILEAATRHTIRVSNTFIGGFSSGGNVSMLLTDYLMSKGSIIQPVGVFIADSPIDLLGLYQSAQETLERNFSDLAVQEANWIVGSLDEVFGVGDTAMVHYEQRSPYLSKTHSTTNLSNLKEVKVRLFSEPDTLWWKENRQAAYENMNAYFIEQLSAELGGLYGEDNIKYIKTKNRGYRANGERHPHSWSIVDEEYLVRWIVNK